MFASELSGFSEDDMKLSFFCMINNKTPTQQTKTI